MRLSRALSGVFLAVAGIASAQTAPSPVPQKPATTSASTEPATTRATTQIVEPPVPVWSRNRSNADAPPELWREFRGAWISSVNNGNWPPKAGMSMAEQKKAAIEQLDRAVELKFNAIVFQVRPAADALYESKLEPWSEYLTGVQGQDPGYDPLQFFIDESHKRGLELHAWLNPYRAKHQQSKVPVARNHISKTHPEVVRAYDGYLWLDPGEPLAARYSMAVFLDIVKRYDIDGIHMDDYFYPYKGKETRDFPDESSYARYQRSGGKLALHDWRRNNVDQFIETLYEQTKKLKPHVKVGIAPFGIWRPDSPYGIQGLDQYDVLYADAKLWLNKGWLDYFSPQLYWKIGGPQSFPRLLDWWIGENTMKRHIWPGQSVGRYNRGPLSMEVPNQLAFMRDRAEHAPNGGSTGFIFWSLGSVSKDSPLTDRLKSDEFAEQAVIPASPWIDDVKPAKPTATVRRTNNGLDIFIKPPTRDRDPDNAPWLWAVQYKLDDGWHQSVFPAEQNKMQIPAATAVAVYTLDRDSNASEPEIPAMPQER